jgi:peptide/nickel transport system ATP-binding protein
MVISVDIQKGARPLVRLEGFDHPSGTIHFLFGESGIGKSLTAKAVCGLLDPHELDVRIDDRPYADYLASHRHFLTDGFYVFQEPSSHLNPLMRITDQMTEGTLAGSDYAAIADELFPAAPFDEIRRLYPRPYRPSGGEKQRVLLAMAFQKIDRMPDGGRGLFVFDEPTSSLDEALRNRVIDRLVERHRRRAFDAWFITHDYSVVSYLLKKHGRKAFAFSEFYRDGDVHVKPFDPDEFISWLGKMGRGYAAPEGEEVLRVSPEFRTHSIHLRIVGKNGDFRLARGEWAYVKGPSGVGKTSFAKAILGFTPSTGLKIMLKGREYSSTTPRRVWQNDVWGKSMSMVFQLSDEALNPQATVRQVLDGTPIADRTRLDALLREAFADPERMRDRPVRFLSGGEKQRLNLVRTLALETDVVILDEPFSGVDFRTMQRILVWIETRRRAGQCFIVISHQEEIFDALIPPEHVYRIERAT